jgi:hypothetical protein
MDKMHQLNAHTLFLTAASVAGALGLFSAVMHLIPVLVH